LRHVGCAAKFSNVGELAVSAYRGPVDRCGAAHRLARRESPGTECEPLDRLRPGAVGGWARRGRPGPPPFLGCSGSATRRAYPDGDPDQIANDGAIRHLQENPMAKKDVLTHNGVKIDCLNISQPVGKNQTNSKNDVKLVQAMFRKLAELGGGPTFL